MTSHKARAEELLELADTVGKIPNADIGFTVEAAQVFATLALVEEMRTANLIARAAIYVANNGQTFPEIEERLTVDDWFCTRCGSACTRHRP